MLYCGATYFGESRDRIVKTLEILTFASLLWQLFKALIHGVLEKFEAQLGAELLAQIKFSLNETVTFFLAQALQLAPNLLKAEAN